MFRPEKMLGWIGVGRGNLRWSDISSKTNTRPEFITLSCFMQLHRISSGGVRGTLALEVMANSRCIEPIECSVTSTKNQKLSTISRGDVSPQLRIIGTVIKFLHRHPFCCTYLCPIQLSLRAGTELRANRPIRARKSSVPWFARACDPNVSQHTGYI